MYRFAACCLLVVYIPGLVRGLPDCNFDKRDHWCDWVQALDDDYQWKARQYPTFSIGTGPQADHTTGSGWFIYTDSRDAEDEGWKTRLLSPLIEGSIDTPTTVMSFWYSMWDELGNSMGTLNVYTMHDDRLSEPVWSHSGPLTNKGEWRQARIVLHSSATFRVVVEGVRGPGPASDIGIDDVEFTQAPLPSSCDFESSDFGPLCGFYQEDIADNFDWSWNAGETPSLDTGPLFDNTFKNDTGHYLFLETTRADEDKTAQLKSFEYYKEPGRCTLELYYHAFGPHLGQLNVFVQDKQFEVDISTSADRWKRFIVNLQDVSGRYTIGFTGIRGNGNLGDIAIDDISLNGIGCFAVDACASNPCLHNAECIRYEDVYRCECPAGWTGEHCQLSIDECYSNPCAEPRVCMDQHNGYECTCPEGWSGDECQQRVTDEPPEKEPEPDTGIPPETVNIIVTVIVIAGIFIITAASLTVYCTRPKQYAVADDDCAQLDPDHEDGINETYQMTDMAEIPQENLAFENKLS